jgi:hypothetical protein
MTEPATLPDDPAGDSDVRPDEADVDGRPLDVSESLDSDDLGSTDAGLDPLDDSWDAPERPSGGLHHGNTLREQRDGESLDQYLAQELPDIDPYREAERRESGAVLDADVYDDTTTRPTDQPYDSLEPLGELVDEGSDIEARLAAFNRRADQDGTPNSPQRPPEDTSLHIDPPT